MGHWKHLDDPPKPVFDPKSIYDPQISIKKIIDDMPVLVDPYGPIKFDPYEGLLPFALAMPHQYSRYAGEPMKPDAQMYDNLIQKAEYQVRMLTAHIESLRKMKEELPQPANG